MDLPTAAAAIFLVFLYIALILYLRSVRREHLLFEEDGPFHNFMKKDSEVVQVWTEPDWHPDYGSKP